MRQILTNFLLHIPGRGGDFGLLTVCLFSPAPGSLSVGRCCMLSLSQAEWCSSLPLTGSKLPCPALPPSTHLSTGTARGWRGHPRLHECMHPVMGSPSVHLRLPFPPVPNYSARTTRLQGCTTYVTITQTPPDFVYPSLLRGPVPRLPCRLTRAPARSRVGRINNCNSSGRVGQVTGIACYGSAHRLPMGYYLYWVNTTFCMLGSGITAYGHRTCHWCRLSRDPELTCG
jgi:hypothetical protein